MNLVRLLIAAVLGVLLWLVVLRLVVLVIEIGQAMNSLVP